MPDCLVLTIDNVNEFHWLPTTCTYRLLVEGKTLPEWHHLVSGNAESVHESGVSVRGRVVSEDDADDLHMHITDWKF